MRSWASRGLEAARLGGDRADLWPAGALASLAFFGWWVLLLVVAPPSPGDLAFFAVSVVTSSMFPLNVALLGVAAVSGFATLCLLAALAEAALVRLARPGDHTPLSGGTLTGFAVILVAALPAAAAAGVLLLGLAGIAPSEFPAPDAVPLSLRLAAALWPQELLLLVAIWIGQALGGLALHRSLARRGAGAGRALVESGRLLARRPLPALGIALIGLVADALVAVVSYALLRVLWAPIAVDLGRGQLAAPETLLLLVGFVAIWLALLLAAGAVHVAVSAWWSLEAAGARRQPAPAGAEPWRAV
ncbi:MAG TPA: hypothetical protein VF013_05345 [Candidatus Limnocylindria bacterium]